MKTSNKLLIGLGICILILITVFILKVRNIALEMQREIPKIEQSISIETEDETESRLNNEK